MLLKSVQVTNFRQFGSLRFILNNKDIQSIIQVLRHLVGAIALKIILIMSRKNSVKIRDAKHVPQNI